MKGKMELLLSHVRCGKSIKDKLKIMVICFLRYLKERSPKRLKKIFDSTVKGWIIETDVKFMIGSIDDYFICSPLHEQYLKDYLKPNKGDTFLDVGAHIGKYTLRVAKVVGDEGLVISVEPDKRNYNLLIKNINLNRLKNVIPLNIAAWHTDEKLKLFFGPNTGESTVKKEGNSYIWVKARALDRVLEELGCKRIDWIKIDVEGAEFEVLKGLENTLKRSNPILIVEVFDKNYDRVMAFLKNLGYKGEVIHRGMGTYRYCTYIVFKKL